MIDHDPEARFNIEVLIRIPGATKTHRIGWLWAPMHIQGGDRFGRSQLSIDLGDIVRKLQEAIEDGVVAK